jgi:23S rRNA (uridine2552-2'-O)-methyltransferase
MDILDGKRPDVVLSDMAPNTCGVRKVDHIRIVNLVEAVYGFCEKTLAHGGAMVVKTFQGGASADILHRMKTSFKAVKHFKPLSSRKESSELYVVSTGYRPTSTQEG